MKVDIMTDQVGKATRFAELHVDGEPLIIYNVWDGGTARALASVGAKAIATGDHPVGFSHGYDNDDFDEFSFDTYLVTIREVVRRAGDLPVSIDINNGNGLDLDGLKARTTAVIEAGAIGVNFEDTTDDETQLRSTEEQAKRITAIRQVADELGVPLFINARCNIFITAGNTPHSELLDEAIARAKSYQQAGGSGFFAPGLMDIGLITKLCQSIESPVNIIKLPGAPNTQDLAGAGVARVSYGPVPQTEMIEWFKDKARAALNGEQ